MGSIQDMNNRIKQNQAQRPSKRAKFKEHNREVIYPSEKKTRANAFKTVSPEQLSVIKKQIKESAVREQRKKRLVHILLLVFGITLLIALVLLAKLIDIEAGSP
ncbi:MAG: hypothetical protein AAGA86_02215 [Bacteroidota bacterium]